MQFGVPKSIDIPDKIIGPLSFKQFLFLAGGASFVYLSFQLVPNPILAGIVGLPFGALGAGLAFLKINGQTFLKILHAGILFLKDSKFYIWYHDSNKKLAEIRKRKLDEKSKEEEMKGVNQNNQNNQNIKKIEDIAWALDVLDRKQ